MAVVEGVGVARLPGLLCQPLLEQNKIQLLLDGAPAASFTVFAAYVSKKQQAPKVRTFVDLLVERRSDFTDSH